MARSSNKSRSSPSNREKPVLFGFMVQRRGADGRVHLAFRWKRILGTFAALIAAGWLGTAGALYFYFKYRKDFETVSYVKMIQLPFRLDEHRKEMGRHHVERGLEAAEEGEFREALRLLSLGISRAPGHLEGRRTLAEFYSRGLKRPEMAAEVLRRGLEHGGLGELDYLRATLKTLLDNQMDQKVQSIAQEHLPDPGAELDDKDKFLAFAAAKANHLRGRYDQAESYLRQYDLLESADGVLLSSEISWDRGQKEAAIAKLERSTDKFPNAEAVFLRLSRYHRERGNLDAARRYAILRNLANPLSAFPRIQLLYIYHEAGQEKLEQRETRRVVQQFRDDEKAMTQVANFAAETGNISLARRCYEEALENEFEIASFALLLIESHLVAEDYQGALSFTEELLKERPDWLQQHWAIFNSLRAVASYGSGQTDFGDIYLAEFLSEQGVTAKTYLAVARRFINIDRDPQARRVIRKAHQLYPKNQGVVTQLIRTNLEVGATENLNHLINKLLEMRRPSTELLAKAYRKLGSDRFIFTANRESLLMELSAYLREAGQSPDEPNEPKTAASPTEQAAK